MKLRLAIVLVLATSYAHAQGGLIQDSVQSYGGVAGATVTVCTQTATGTPCSPLATIYSDPDLAPAHQISNSQVTTDANGNYHYYMTPGTIVQEQISGPGIATTTQTMQAGPSGIVTSGTVTNIATSGPLTGGPITTTGTIGCPTCAVTSTGLNQFASTTSAQLLGIISDEIGAGKLVFANALQGTDTNLLTAGTISGTGVSLCTDANGGATTTGCAGGGGTFPISMPKVTSKWLDSYNSATGLFTQTQPNYADISGTPQLAITKTAVASNWLRSYDSVTGLFTASQPAFTDISGVGSCAQEPALTGDVTSSGCVATLAAIIPGTHTFSGAINNTNTTSGNSDCIHNGMYIAGSSCYTTIAAALAAAPSGATVYSIAGHSETISSPVNITSPVTIILDGNSITASGAINALQIQASNVTIRCTNSTLFTDSGSGAGAIGVGNGGAGVYSNITIDGCQVNGAGTVGLGQAGIGFSSLGATDLVIENNTITNVNVGITIVDQPTSGSPLISGLRIINNYIKNIPGSAVGSGYGIVVGNSVVTGGAQTMQFMGVEVTNNYIESAGRHSIYVAAGSGTLISHNYIKSNACISTPNGSLTAIPLSRKRGSIVSNNIIDGACDLGLQITGDTTFTGDSLIASETLITGNMFMNGQSHDIVIGNSAPATNGTPDHIIVSNNVIYNTSNNNYGIWFHCGTDIVIANNSLQKFTTNGYVIRFEEETETAGTANFTDRVFIRGNIISSTNGGSTDTGVGFSATAAASGSNIWFTDNRINSTSQWFTSGGGGILNTNIRVFNSDANFNASAFLTTVAYKTVPSWPEAMNEQFAPPTGVGLDVLYADATAHAFKASYNNGAFGIIPLTTAASTTANFPLLTTTTANSYTPSTIAYPTTITGSGCLVFSSSTTQLACGANIAANKLVRAGGAGTAPNASSFTDGGTANLSTTTNMFTGNNTVRLTANSSAITALTPGTAVLTFGALPVSTNLSFNCYVLYNQQTAAVAGTGFAIQSATNAPTRLDAWSNMYTSNAGASVQGTVQNLTTTTATSLVTGTPSAITTVFHAEMHGSIQVGATAGTLTLLAFTGNASDSITVQAGSFCSISP